MVRIGRMAMAAAAAEEGEEAAQPCSLTMGRIPGRTCCADCEARLGQRRLRQRNTTSGKKSADANTGQDAGKLYTRAAGKLVTIYSTGDMSRETLGEANTEAKVELGVGSTGNYGDLRQRRTIADATIFVQMTFMMLEPPTAMGEAAESLDLHTSGHSEEYAEVKRLQVITHSARAKTLETHVKGNQADTWDDMDTWHTAAADHSVAIEATSPDETVRRRPAALAETPPGRILALTSRRSS